jgi:3-dehydroquinate dehydratase-2
MKILVIHGPNLNLLGIREPEVYGTQTLPDLNARLADHARGRGVELDIFHSNHEGDLIDRIQAAGGVGGVPSLRADAIVINPGAYTHTSLAIADAIAGIGVPAIEVHMSDIHSRGELRSRSLIAGVCRAQITGRGFDSYIDGIDAAIEALAS